MSKQALIDLSSAQSWLKQSSYKPSTLQLSTMHRLTGCIAQANVAFDDHPTGDRIIGKVEVATVKSLLPILLKNRP